MKADFVGFTFNGIHSEDFGLYHVSDGSRYNDNLLPNIQDMTAQVPGGDGMYYWDSYYVQRQFNIQVAFDKIDEEKFMNMRRWLGDRGIHELWFDELPFKVYMAKVTTAPQFKYICFGEGTTNRIYKGEGTITFTCFYPYAMSKNGKYLSDFSNYTNVNEWATASRMLNSSTVSTAQIDNYTSGHFYVYNAGDLPTDWKLTVTLASNSIGTYSVTGGDLNLYLDASNITNFTNLPSYNSTTTKATFEINSRTELITSTSGSNVVTCNKMIDSGGFFKIPVSTSRTDILDFSAPNGVSIQYDYLYL